MFSFVPSSGAASIVEEVPAVVFLFSVTRPFMVSAWHSGVSVVGVVADTSSAVDVVCRNPDELPVSIIDGVSVVGIRLFASSTVVIIEVPLLSVGDGVVMLSTGAVRPVNPLAVSITEGEEMSASSMPLLVSLTGTLDWYGVDCLCVTRVVASLAVVVEYTVEKPEG